VRLILSNLSSLRRSAGDDGEITNLCGEPDRDCTIFLTTGELRALSDRDCGLVLPEFFGRVLLLSKIVGRPALSDVIPPESSNNYDVRYL
jgi:hypothetical protein